MTSQQTDICLTSVMIDPASGLVRQTPRPADLRNAGYAAAFDHDTLFYDCYRVGAHIVLQGPPLLNLIAPLLASAPISTHRRRWIGRPRLISRDKRGELWLRSPDDTLTLTGPAGTYPLTIGPNLSQLYAGRRVLLTLSKDNAPRWIRDWVQFYRAEHGADGVLIYDNGSTAYSAAWLQDELRTVFPGMVIHVVSWPFKYGPQGGMAGAVDGREAPWDSDFCQTGSLQHARLRLLRHARSVLNVDIDELVLGPGGTSIFAHTERSRSGFIKFAGSWISSASSRAITQQTFRHADFTHRDTAEARTCPAKWCLVPGRDHPLRTSWSVHNLFGTRHNRRIDPHFSYRHMTAISTSWKEDRTIAGGFDPWRFAEDTALAESFARAGL